MTILTAIDVTKDAESLLTTAHELASAYDEQLAVLYVVPEEVYENRRQDLTRRDENTEYPISRAEEEASRDVEEVIETALAVSDEETPEVVPMGRIGEPLAEILAVADELDARYLVIGGRKRTPTGKALFGSLTQSILLNAERPVVTVMRG